MSPFWLGLLAGIFIGGTAGFVLTRIVLNYREDRFWKRVGVKRPE